MYDENNWDDGDYWGDDEHYHSKDTPISNYVSKRNWDELEITVAELAQFNSIFSAGGFFKARVLVGNDVEEETYQFRTHSVGPPGIIIEDLDGGFPHFIYKEFNMEDKITWTFASSAEETSDLSFEEVKEVVRSYLT